MTAASLFTRLQSADFYRAMHARAADLLPAGDGMTWLDVGCGPGVMSRLAAHRGYRVRGIDRSPAMIEAARRIAQREQLSVDFGVSTLESELSSDRRYDVVSASSLLVVLPDSKHGLSQLEALVRPGGRLLVIEASPTMRVVSACRLILTARLGSRAPMLLAWASARSGRTLPTTLFPLQEGGWTHTPLLHGMATAYLRAIPR
jgi:2-polyprenyl-3-methyl-5-hydroxy-6-metoxy-1,4-benzoquinol methylase